MNALDGVISGVRERLLRARRVVALTGAGVSAESGVPTFRGAGGLWRSHKAVELATPEAFARDPALVWAFYNWRRELLAACRPNPAHLAIAAIESRLGDSLTLITQNVDGLHAQAGSRNILELHGNIWRLRCTACGHEAEDRRVPLPALPACAACGGLLRPGVVWFGEALSADVLTAAFSACERAEVMLVCGTSGVVYPAAGMAAHARARGAFTVEVNPEATPHTPGFDAVLAGKAGEILPRLL